MAAPARCTIRSMRSLHCPRVAPQGTGGIDAPVPAMVSSRSIASPTAPASTASSIRSPLRAAVMALEDAERVLPPSHPCGPSRPSHRAWGRLCALSPLCASAPRGERLRGVGRIGRHPGRVERLGPRAHAQACAGVGDRVGQDRAPVVGPRHDGARHRRGVRGGGPGEIRHDGACADHWGGRAAPLSDRFARALCAFAPGQRRSCSHSPKPFASRVMSRVQAPTTRTPPRYRSRAERRVLSDNRRSLASPAPSRRLAPMAGGTVPRSPSRVQPLM